MQDGEDILNQFLLEKEVIVIENQDFAPVLTALNELKSKPAESIPVSDHNCSDISCTNSSQYGKELRSFAVETAANLSDQFGSRIEVNQSCNLSLQVWFLSSAADSGVQNDSFGFSWRFGVAVEVIPSRPARWCTYCLDPTFLFPSPQGVETHPKIIRRLSRFYIPRHAKQPC